MNIKLLVKKYGPAAEFIISRRNKAKKNLLPWTMTYLNILNRCGNNRDRKFAFYGGRGIKCRIRPLELKELFYRDKAYLMKQPSIDRIDPEGDYTPENTRWIEMELNRMQKGLAHPKYSSDADIIEKAILEKLESTNWPVRLKKNLLRRIVKKL